MAEHEALKSRVVTALDQREAEAREWFTRTIDCNGKSLSTLVNVLGTGPQEFKQAIAVLPDTWLNAIRKLALNGLMRASVDADNLWDEIL